MTRHDLQSVYNTEYVPIFLLIFTFLKKETSIIKADKRQQHFEGKVKIKTIFFSQKRKIIINETGNREGFARFLHKHSSRTSSYILRYAATTSRFILHRQRRGKKTRKEN